MSWKLLIFIIISNTSLAIELCLPSQYKLRALNSKLSFNEKQIFFHNVYQPIFEYNPNTKKYLSLIGKKLTLKNSLYTLEINKKFYFQNNQSFFVKKTIDAKDIIFSWHKTKLTSKLTKITEVSPTKIQFSSKLKLKEIYTLLSSTQSIIFSRAYYKYLEKKQRLDLFYKKPIGSGPYQFKRNKGHYKLVKNKLYPFKVFIREINIITSNDYKKCDILFDPPKYEEKEIKKQFFIHPINSYSKIALFIPTNYMNAKYLKKFVSSKKVFNQLNIKLKEIDYSLFPRSLSKIHHAKTRNFNLNKLKRIKTISYKKLIDSNHPFNIEKFEKAIKSILLKHKLKFVYSDQKKINSPTLFSVTYISNKDDINHKVLCPLNSIYCNKDFSEHDLIKSDNFIPLMQKQHNWVIKKNLLNTTFDLFNGIKLTKTLKLSS
ncbi:MAG: hypothetical protein N4A33_00340 [Bacteriovoracaceae bacterium]|jgi:ABC-type transport system substrate-binding protein|nr:hypothetical protein [Bacteriovoracaceae bacterium]